MSKVKENVKSWGDWWDDSLLATISIIGYMFAAVITAVAVLGILGKLA